MRNIFSHSRSLITFTLVVVFFMTANQSLADECHLTPVIHKLQYPGCQDVTIPSYACVGRCTSYVKVWYWNLKKKKSYLFFKKNKDYFNVILWNIHRCLVLRFGKPKDRACAAKKVENEWLLCLWIVPMLLPTNQESER